MGESLSVIDACLKTESVSKSAADSAVGPRRPTQLTLWTSRPLEEHENIAVTMTVSHDRSPSTLLRGYTKDRQQWVFHLHGDQDMRITYKLLRDGVEELLHAEPDVGRLDFDPDLALNVAATTEQDFESIERTASPLQSAKDTAADKSNSEPATFVPRQAELAPRKEPAHSQAVPRRQPAPTVVRPAESPVSNSSTPSSSLLPTPTASPPTPSLPVARPRSKRSLDHLPASLRYDLPGSSPRVDPALSERALRPFWSPPTQ